MSASFPVFETPPTAHSQGGIVREGYVMLTEILCEPLHELFCTADITPKFFVVFDVFPFAAGAQRIAFKGSIYERNLGTDPTFRVQVVVKFEMAVSDMVTKSESERTRINSEEARKTILKHELAAEYADKWSKLGINKSVYVLSTERLKITKGCSLGEIPQQRFPMLHYLFKKLSLDSVLYRGAVGTVEDLIPGKFTKFLNNDGNSNSKVVANFPAAFAHWTWVESAGTVMISDIQGTRTGQGYVLTDPCVHSVGHEDGYGLSDLGLQGIEEFFEKHRCNELCRDLGLGKDQEDLDLGHLVRTRMLNSISTVDYGNREPSNGTFFPRDKNEIIMEKSALADSDGKLRRRNTLVKYRDDEDIEMNQSITRRHTEGDNGLLQRQKRCETERTDRIGKMRAVIQNIFRHPGRGLNR